MSYSNCDLRNDVATPPPTPPGFFCDGEYDFGAPPSTPPYSVYDGEYDFDAPPPPPVYRSSEQGVTEELSLENQFYEGDQESPHKEPSTKEARTGQPQPLLHPIVLPDLQAPIPQQPQQPVLKIFQEKLQLLKQLETQLTDQFLQQDQKLMQHQLDYLQDPSASSETSIMARQQLLIQQQALFLKYQQQINWLSLQRDSVFKQYTQSDSKVGIWQSRHPEFEPAEAAPVLTQGRCRQVSKSGMPAQPKPTFESRGVYTNSLNPSSQPTEEILGQNQTLQAQMHHQPMTSQAPLPQPPPAVPPGSHKRTLPEPTTPPAKKSRSGDPPPPPSPLSQTISSNQEQPHIPSLTRPPLFIPHLHSSSAQILYQQQLAQQQHLARQHQLSAQQHIPPSTLGSPIVVPQIHQADAVQPATTQTQQSVGPMPQVNSQKQLRERTAGMVIPKKSSQRVPQHNQKHAIPQPENPQPQAPTELQFINHSQKQYIEGNMQCLEEVATRIQKESHLTWDQLAGLCGFRSEITFQKQLRSPCSLSRQYQLIMGLSPLYIHYCGGTRKEFITKAGWEDWNLPEHMQKSAFLKLMMAIVLTKTGQPQDALANAWGIPPTILACLLDNDNFITCLFNDDTQGDPFKEGNKYLACRLFAVLIPHYLGFFEGSTKQGFINRATGRMKWIPKTTEPNEPIPAITPTQKTVRYNTYKRGRKRTRRRTIPK